MSFLSSIPTWGWFDIGFNVAVLVALGGETEIILRWMFPDRAEDLLSPETRRKELKKICEWLLIFGIAGEISCLPFSLYGTASAEKDAAEARLETVKLEQQVLETSNNIVKNDVRNWPISEVTATAWFAVLGTNMDVELTNLPSGRKARMTLWKNERDGIALDALEAASSDIFGQVSRPTIGLVDRRIYRVQLRSFNFMSALNGTFGISPPLVKTIDDVHLVHVDLNFLPRDSEFSGAVIDLTVNGVSRRFMAPEQNDTNSNMGGWNDFQCWFVGTNGVQSSPKQFLYLRN